MRKSTVFKSLCGSLLASTTFVGVALAQTNPSAQEIINSLTPTGSVSDTTRGIKPLAPDDSSSTPPPMAMSAAPMAMSAAPPAQSPHLASTNLDVEFQSGSANLTPEAVATLDQLGKALTSSTLASFTFKIVGHTDTTGAPATNQTLSEQRAEAVKSYLETKFGVSDSRLQAEGVGESDLLIATPANTPEPQNRRVQIINLGQ
jgi:outer membrane protein OmpA-like peptidoglycan-associated protein